MKLSEETKTSIKSITKQSLDLAKQNKLCDIDIDTMRQYVKSTFVFLGLTDVNQEDIDELVHDLEYEVSIHHTNGCAIFNDYDSNLHNWYDKIRTDNQPFWNRYRRYLIEKSSLDQKSIDLLDFDTLPKKNYGKQIYWVWTRVNNKAWYAVPYDKRWHPPKEVVKVFEKYGFIWGGKWHNYDTIHFEYRPELIIYNKLKDDEDSIYELIEKYGIF